MADNITTDDAVTSGIPDGTQIAFDDIGAGVLVQRVKVTWGADGSMADVSAANKMPVQVDAAGRGSDSVAAADSTDAIMSLLTVLTPKFQKIVASTTGLTTIVAAVASRKIRVVRWSLVCSAAVNVKWQSQVGPTDLTGLHYFAVNGGISEPYCKVGHFETIAGEALSINLSGNVPVGGSLTYIEVP